MYNRSIETEKHIGIAVMVTIKKILKAVNNPYLKMFKGDGYFYFEYDHGLNIFSHHSVYVNNLNHLPFDVWVEISKSLCEYDL